MGDYSCLVPSPIGTKAATGFFRGRENHEEPQHTCVGCSSHEGHGVGCQLEGIRLASKPWYKRMAECSGISHVF